MFKNIKILIKTSENRNSGPGFKIWLNTPNTGPSPNNLVLLWKTSIKIMTSVLPIYIFTIDLVHTVETTQDFK